MSVSELHKTAFRAKVTIDAEKTAEKFARAQKNFIKLEVARDSAYWDLKEQLQQSQSNHAALQKNMLQLQLQYEAVSSKYQDELKMRAETLNRHTSTREICDVLQQYVERLRETLVRCRSDQETLNEAYNRSGAVIRDLKTQQTQFEEKFQLITDSLKEKANSSTARCEELRQMYDNEKKRADSEHRERITMLAQRDELLGALRELERAHQVQVCEIEKRNDQIKELERDQRQLLRELDSKTAEWKTQLSTKDKENTELSSLNEAMKQALANQEAFTNNFREQTNQLTEKVAVLEEMLQNQTSQLNSRDSDLATAKDHIEALIKENDHEKQRLADVEKENDVLKEKLINADLINKDTNDKLNKAAVEIQEVTSTVENLTSGLNKITLDFQNYRETSESKISELTQKLAQKQQELDAKGEVIGQLMNNLQVESDQRMKLQALVKNKEDEIAKSMRMILELRSEKTALQEKIRELSVAMENAKNALNKDVPAPAPNGPRFLPEQDDNAIMNVSPTEPRALSSTDQQKLKPPTKTESTRNKALERFNLFSDDGSKDSFRLSPRVLSSIEQQKKKPPTNTEPARNKALDRFNFFSDDGSNDSIHLRMNNEQGSRRQERAPQQQPAAPAPSSAIKRRNDEILTLAQLREGMTKRNQERKFFKSRRSDSKNTKK